MLCEIKILKNKLVCHENAFFKHSSERTPQPHCFSVNGLSAASREHLNYDTHCAEIKFTETQLQWDNPAHVLNFGSNTDTGCDSCASLVLFISEVQRPQTKSRHKIPLVVQQNNSINKNYNSRTMIVHSNVAFSHRSVVIVHWEVSHKEIFCEKTKKNQTFFQRFYINNPSIHYLPLIWSQVKEATGPVENPVNENHKQVQNAP